MIITCLNNVYVITLFFLSKKNNIVVNIAVVKLHTTIVIYPYL